MTRRLQPPMPSRFAVRYQFVLLALSKHAPLRVFQASIPTTRLSASTVRIAPRSILLLPTIPQAVQGQILFKAKYAVSGPLSASLQRQYFAAHPQVLVSSSNCPAILLNARLHTT